jgi:hypothetical protein
MVNSPTTTVAELRGRRMAIAACFAFQREIGFSTFSTASVKMRNTHAEWMSSASALKLVGGLRRTFGWVTTPP